MEKPSKELIEQAARTLMTPPAMPGGMYLNQKAVIICPHGGKLQWMPTPMKSFWDNGAPILTDQDLLLRTVIMGCPQYPSPCVKVTSVLSGVGRQFLVDGERPLTDMLKATTNAAPTVIVLFDGGSDCKVLPGF